MTTLNATFDPFVGTLTTTDYGFVHFSSTGLEVLDNACMKIQNMGFKTSKMD